jgi:hypothetical protein
VSRRLEVLIHFRIDTIWVVAVTQVKKESGPSLVFVYLSIFSSVLIVSHFLSSFVVLL